MPFDATRSDITRTALSIDFDKLMTLRGAVGVSNLSVRMMSTIWFTLRPIRWALLVSRSFWAVKSSARARMNGMTWRPCGSVSRYVIQSLRCASRVRASATKRDSNSLSRNSAMMPSTPTETVLIALPTLWSIVSTISTRPSAKASATDCSARTRSVTSRNTTTPPRAVAIRPEAGSHWR